MSAAKKDTATVTGHAQSLAAACPVEEVGQDWGPTPLWRATLDELNATVDLYATSEDDVRAQLPDLIQGMLDQRAARDG